MADIIISHQFSYFMLTTALQRGDRQQRYSFVVAQAKSGRTCRKGLLASVHLGKLG